MRLAVAVGSETVALDLMGKHVLEARAALVASNGGASEAVGLSLLVLGLLAYRGAGLALYASYGSLVAMAGPALDVLAEKHSPVGVLLTAAAVARAVLDPQAPAAPVAEKPAVREPPIPDPYPGLTRNKETWPMVAVRLAGNTTIEAMNEKAEWRAAGQAYDAGRIAEWVTGVGGALGFVWTAPEGG